MKPKKKSWIVRMRCEVLKDVYCYDCTEQEARDSPFDHAEDEREVDQMDYEVKSVQENK